ncbi:Uncharacterised protein [Mycobacteroides abscessus subsp. abscessus]|nr:Uncharacterised protein [Mycobacteroides abscessus subsp. abscessus]
MHEIGRDRSGDLDVRARQQPHPVEILDLRHRGLQHLGQVDRHGAVAADPGAREHEQVVAVAAHAGDQVVEPEQAAQPGWVGLVVLEFLDQAELLVDEGTVAT